MKKQLTEKTVYQPNSKLKVTVTNAPRIADDGMPAGWKRSVTFKVDAGYSPEKLSFDSTDALDEFINDIDTEDPQQELGL